MSNDPNTTVQYTVILLRDDSEAQLPGQPNTGLPLTFQPGLEPGEPVFTADTGRMFIGHSPSAGQINFRRTTFPYQNIEVLTEASVDKFNAMVAAYGRETSDDAVYRTVLPAAADPSIVTLPRAGDPTYAFRFTTPDSLAATVDYSAFDKTGRPVRIGRLNILHASGNAIPIVQDTGLDMDGAPALVLSATEEGPVGGRYVVLRYTYAGLGSLTLTFRVTHTHGDPIAA